MAIFDSAAEGMFKRTREGQLLFYPWGTLGKGYAVPTEEHAEAIRCFLRTYAKFSVPISIAIVPTVSSLSWPWQLGIIIFVVASLPLVYRSEVTRLVRGLEHTDQRLTFRESVLQSALHGNVVVIWFLSVFGLALFSHAVYLLLQHPSDWARGVGALILGALFLAEGLYLLSVRVSYRRSSQVKGKP